MISSAIAALPRPVSAASGATRSRKIGIKVEDVPVMGCVVSFRAASRPARNRGTLRWGGLPQNGARTSALWLRARAPRCGPPAAGTASETGRPGYSETGRPGYVGGCPGMTLSSTLKRGDGMDEQADRVDCCGPQISSRSPRVVQQGVIGWSAWNAARAIHALNSQNAS